MDGWARALCAGLGSDVPGIDYYFLCSWSITSTHTRALRKIRAELVEPGEIMDVPWNLIQPWRSTIYMYVYVLLYMRTYLPNLNLARPPQSAVTGMEQL